MNNLVLKWYWRIVLGLVGFSLLTASDNTSASVLDAGAFTCGVQVDNTLTCWGSNDVPPSGIFSQVGVGQEHACGIRLDNTVICWGDNREGQATPPSGIFSQISAGRSHNCGIQMDGQVKCWGINNHGQSTPPSGTFSQVSAGLGFTCGIRIDNTLACWGHYTGYVEEAINGLFPWKNPGGTFAQLGAAYNHICGIRVDNSLVCWGLGGDVVEMSDGDDLSKLKPGPHDGRTSPPSSGTFYQVAGGARWFTCWLRTDNAVICSGADDMPGVEAVRPPGAISCICEGRPGCICESPSGLFYQISAGVRHACGIRPDHTVKCWGGESGAPNSPPAGLIVKSADPACLLYGVHNDDDNTQFFIINSGTSEVHARGKLDNNLNIEALDTHPLTNQLYAASQNGTLYQISNGAQAVTDFGETNLPIRGLTFHPDGVLWGWAAETGLFRIENSENNEPDLETVEVILPLSAQIEIADLTWDTAGTRLYGVQNLSWHESNNQTPNHFEGVKLWAYHTHDGVEGTVCDDFMESLNEKVEALEMLPNDILLLSYSKDNNLIIKAIDVETCELIKQQPDEISTDYPPKILTDYRNVKGLAQPNCSHPYINTAF